MQIRPIDNFALSKVIIPQLIEKLKVCNHIYSNGSM